MIRSFLKGGVFHKTPQLHENASISKDSDIVNKWYVDTKVDNTQIDTKQYVDTQITTAKVWSAITNKPETATRWPRFDEVTNKPTTFTPPSATQTVIGGAKMHIASGVLYIVTI